MKKDNIEETICSTCGKTLYIDKTKDIKYEGVHTCYIKQIETNNTDTILSNLTPEDLASTKESQ